MYNKINFLCVYDVVFTLGSYVYTYKEFKKAHLEFDSSVLRIFMKLLRYGWKSTQVLYIRHEDSHTIWNIN